MAVPVESLPKFGLPALQAFPAGPMQVRAELLAAGRLNGDAITVTGKTLAENLRDVPDGDREVIRRYDDPLQNAAG